MQVRILWLLSFCWCGLLLSAQTGSAAGEWNPQTFAKEETLEIRTVGTGESEYWFPVWLVVINEQVYVRLGTRAAERVKGNTTAPYLGIKISGQQFDRVKGEEAPKMAEPVAKAMAEKYWNDLFIRFFSHPLTLRLIPEEKQ